MPRRITAGAAQGNREVEELITADIDPSEAHQGFELGRRTDLYVLEDHRTGQTY